MINYNYKTIKNRSEGIFKDRGSKFLAFAFPVSTEDQVKEITDNLRREYHDARHHCYAWRLGADMEHFRANDDGEPSKTAGRPVLGQIQKYELTDILIVVVRYFGGTLLGTGGLINAYRSAATDSLEQAEIIIKDVKERYEVKFPYSAMNDVMKVLKEEQADQVSQDFDMDCKILVSIPLERSDRLTGRLCGIEQVKISRVQ